MAGRLAPLPRKAAHRGSSGRARRGAPGLAQFDELAQVDFDLHVAPAGEVAHFALREVVMAPLDILLPAPTDISSMSPTKRRACGESSSSVRPNTSCASAVPSSTSASVASTYSFSFP